MQALIPLFAILAVCSGTELTLLPYAYLADPLPVYHQSQNTQTGEHAYSYAGGPSAKEEVRGLDGVTRGSYSYVDANGILQSVFYVADEGGFRVAATNLPTNDEHSVEPAEVILARNASPEEHSRRKRSLDDSDRSSDQNEEEQKDSSSKEDLADQQPSESVHSFVYQVPGSVLLPRLVTATSHQSQVQVHRNVKLSKPESIVKVAAEPVYQSVLVQGEIPLETSHQSQDQVHSNLNVEQSGLEGVFKAKEPVLYDAALTPIVHVEPVPLVAAAPSYHQNRIQLHKNIGLEGPNRKDAVKIRSGPFAILEAPLTTVPVLPTVLAKQAVPVLPTVLKEAVPVVQPVGKIATATVTTSVSSHGVSQIHGDSKLRLAAPLVAEPGLLVKTAVPLLQPLPYAAASHARVQIHSK